MGKKATTSAKPKAPTAPKAPKNATVAHVDDAGGRIRTYSKEEHGDAFLDNANEFASKVAGREVVTE